MNNIQISFEEVLATSQLIRRMNQQMSEHHEEMRRLMNSLEPDWQSETSQTIRRKFNGLTKHFEQYHAVVESYASFLDEMVENYRMTESNLNRNAESFV